MIGTETASNGKASITYKPNIYSGIATVNATANNANISTSFIVNNLNIYVSTTGNDITGDGITNNPYQTIKHSILLVSLNGTLYIANGIYIENNFQINKDITITGENQQNTIIDAQGNGNIFDITPDEGINLTFVNLTVQNGKSTNGGAIDNEDIYGILNITNITFTNNTAKYYGGAIFNYGTLIANNSTFTNNTANYGGAISNVIGTATETNNTFNKNTANYGGAIYNVYGTVTETNNTFNKNTANYGGAIFNNVGTLTITDSKLLNNTATFGGGAIYNHGNAYVNFNWIIGNITPIQSNLQ